MKVQRRIPRPEPYANRQKRSSQVPNFKAHKVPLRSHQGARFCLRAKLSVVELRHFRFRIITVTTVPVVMVVRIGIRVVP